jgi:DNA-directed RNA polymerase subunit RPC12/RpoP
LKKSNWRSKHIAFVQMVRGARGGSETVVTQQVDPNPDYVSCPHCSRRFNESAGERHIPYCKEKIEVKRRASANASANASRSSSGNISFSKEEALKKRMSYQPPTPKQKKK